MGSNNTSELKGDAKTTNGDVAPPATMESQVALKELENEMLDTFVERSANVRINSRDAVSFGINFSTKIMSLLGVPFANQIGQLWNFTLGALWPKQDNTWNNLIDFVEELIDQKVENAVRKKANSELEGLGNVLEIYYDVLSDWEDEPDNENRKEHVRTQFRIANNLFEQQMPSFAVEGFEVPLLAVYAYAANLHLLLLRDCAIYGKDWGFEPIEIDSNYSRQLKRTIKYSDHCTDWYNEGLEDLRGPNAKDWPKYNKYRREMTFNVLDVCSLFSNYDYHNYPLETRMELTRDIYTDAIPVGTKMENVNWVKKFPPFKTIEELSIRKPHTVTWLNTLEIYTGRSMGWSQRFDFWMGHVQTYSETIAGNNFTGQLYGHKYDDTKPDVYQLVNNDVYSIASTAFVNAYPTGIMGIGVAGSRFDFKKLSNGSEESYSYGKNDKANIITQLPGDDTDVPTVEDYSHRLTYMTGFEVLNAGTILCACWTSTSVDRNNTLEEEMITEIPGVKGNRLDRCAIVKGSGSTGGDLVKAANSNSTFGLNVRSVSSQSYRIRLRYAANTNNTLKISCSDAGINTSVDIPETGDISNDDFSYGLFNYVELPLEFKTSPNKDYNFKFTFGRENMYIDRFEFIPITDSLLEYKEKREIAIDELEKQLADLKNS